MPPQLFRFDSLAAASIAAYAALWLVTVLSAPRRDLEGRGLSRMALMFAATALAYAAASLWVFLIAWFLTRLLCYLATPHLPRISLIRGSAVLAIGAILLELPPSDATRAAAFAALALAALLRKGVLPFHTGASDAMEDASLPLMSLFINSHLGAYLLLRFAAALISEAALPALPVIGVFTLVMALYAAVRALAETAPRRILGLVCESQAAFILAGIANLNVEGLTGALLYWWLVAFSTTGLLAVYRALEVRTTEVEAPRGYLGLAFHAPRLAVFFALFGLSLIGLPGTLGFIAEDLLFHGALESHPFLGVALPLATALNAITVFRLFATLFLGRRGSQVPFIPDALPKERWALSASAVFLIAGGLIPNFLIALRAPTAHWFAGLLGVR